jgi:hypothetical protein
METEPLSAVVRRSIRVPLLSCNIVARRYHLRFESTEEAERALLAAGFRYGKGFRA